MIKTIIWVRHGEVNTPEKQYDQLLPNGKEFALRLPGLLRHNSITPDVVYFDESIDREGGFPKRCKETIMWLEEVPKESFACANTVEAQRFLLEVVSKRQVSVICYKTESFFKFPPIKESTFEKYMNNNSKPQEKSVYDKLYDEMLVTTFDGANLILQKTIPTGMRSTSILAEARS